MSKKTKLKYPQQISFIGKLLSNTAATIIFIIAKSKEITFSFSQNSVTIIKIMDTQKIVHLLNNSDNGNSKFTMSQKVIIQKMTQ